MHTTKRQQIRAETIILAFFFKSCLCCLSHFCLVIIKERSLSLVCLFQHIGTSLGWTLLDPHTHLSRLDSTMWFRTSTQSLQSEGRSPDPLQQRGTRGSCRQGRWRAERPAGTAWRAGSTSLSAAAGSQQGVRRHICKRKTALLWIWRSCRLTAVETLIIYSLCWFQFRQKEEVPEREIQQSPTNKKKQFGLHTYVQADYCFIYWTEHVE